jgi:hypothetical protein
MKKIYIVLLIVAAVLICAVLTNPGPDKHRSAVKSIIKEAMLESVREEDSDQAAIMGPMLVGLAVDNYVNQLVKSHNYILFSTTEVMWGEEVKTVGVGAFGTVFLSDRFNKEEVKKVLDRYFD